MGKENEIYWALKIQAHDKRERKTWQPLTKLANKFQNKPIVIHKSMSNSSTIFTQLCPQEPLSHGDDYSGLGNTDES